MDTASERAVPAIGTEVPRMNFAVRIDSVSAAELTAVCILKTPRNRVVISESIQKASFLIPSAMPERETSGETDELMLTAR